MRAIMQLTLVALFLSLFSAALWGDTVVGYISWDVTLPGSSGQFDISNDTGPNASVFPDMTFPITTSVDLKSLALTVDFSDGSVTNFGASYFTLDPDGLSLHGNPIAIGGTNAQPIDATLTGDFSPLIVTLNDGSTQTIDAAFSTTILPSSPPNLSDGDLAIIFAKSAGGPPPVPEPSTGLLSITVFVGILALRRFDRRSSARISTRPHSS
jgi:hypothetical protein